MKNKRNNLKKPLLLAGALTLFACAPAIQQGTPSPENGRVSPELLQELSDSVDSYTPRLETERDAYLERLAETSATTDSLGISLPSGEPFFVLQSRMRLEALEKVRTWLGNYDGSPLNNLEKEKVRMVAEYFLGTSNHADVGSTLSDLEMMRQTGTWRTYAGILESVLPRER
ncbi:MAG TPA: hypothetical protein ENH99_00920 [Candidatus Pacearchaeota archaeon]|nr:hypothetical protein [Candidatus Pacearchaeota archaeon]